MTRICRIVLWLALACYSCAWEWSDLLQLGGTPLMSSPSTLTLQEISEMRVRDIKRRLARNHGYGADEISRMLDKKELINALAFEEHKIRQKKQAEFQREALKTAILVTVLAGAVVLFWPLLRHLWEVAYVNFVVYTDRKKLEAVRCWELRSIQGCVGITIMFLLDVIQVWLTVSVLLSWFMSSKYFFPFPSIPVRPAAMMGGEVASGPLGQYGINVGPIVITWLLRFSDRRLERWVGQAMANAQRAQRKQQRARETAEEKQARRARRAARRAAREEAQRHQEQQSNPRRHAQESLIEEDLDFVAKAEDTQKQCPSREEMRSAAAAAAGKRRTEAAPSLDDAYGKFEEID